MPGHATLGKQSRIALRYAEMIKNPVTTLLLGLCLAVCPSAPCGPAQAQTENETETDEEDEIEVERTIELQATLVGVEALPQNDRTIARFRILDGEYAGALFSFAYDYSRPVRLRSWDVHNESGYRRIGGARVTELPLGQWDYILMPGARRPVRTINLTLTQYDLNEDEEKRRWHFKTLESIVPAQWNGYDPQEIRLDPQAARADR